MVKRISEEIIMTWNDKAYDNWKLASPYDDEHNIEVFETEKFGYVSNDEDAVNDFDHKMNLAVKNDCMYLHICDDLEEYAEHLAEELTLYKDEYELISTLEENYHDDKLEAQERKVEQDKDDRLTGDK